MASSVRRVLARWSIELGAPLALLGGRIARMWAWRAWGFHVGVVLVMNIWFPYPLVGIAFLPLFAAERVVAARCVRGSPRACGGGRRVTRAGNTGSGVPLRLQTTTVVILRASS